MIFNDIIDIQLCCQVSVICVKQQAEEKTYKHEDRGVVKACPAHVYSQIIFMIFLFTCLGLMT
jgi:hypothetical protein